MVGDDGERFGHSFSIEDQSTQGEQLLEKANRCVILKCYFKFYGTAAEFICKLSMYKKQVNLSAELVWSINMSKLIYQETRGLFSVALCPLKFCYQPEAFVVE